MTRAERRHRDKVQQQRAYQQMSTWSGEYDPEWKREKARRWRDHMRLCSKECCKHYGGGKPKYKRIDEAVRKVGE